MRITTLILATLALAACDSQGPGPGNGSLATLSQASNSAATSRPIEEFLAANSVGGFYLWAERSDRPSDGRRIWVDYSGRFRSSVLAQSGGAVDLPTTFSGSITERALSDGSAELHVTLHAKDALVWSDAGAPGGFAPLFGYNIAGVASGRTPGLATVQMSLVYINPAGPGAPIQNITTIPDLARIRLVVNGSGVLRAGFDPASEGAPGRISSVQNGVQSQGQGQGVADGYPVEFVNIRAVGK